MKVDNLSQKALKGLKWTYVSTISTALFQILYTSIMARILNPADFGLMAIAGIMLKFGSYFANMGLGKAIIQKEVINQRNIQAGYTFSMCLGLIICVASWLAAPLLALLFDNQSVTPILRVLSITWLISGFTTVFASLLKKNLNFNQLAKIEIFSYFLGYFVIAIPMGISGFGVWSLVAAQLSQSLALAILCFVASKQSLKLLFSWKDVKPLFNYGTKMSLISFLEYVTGTLDTFFVGRMLGTKTLGFYNRGLMLVQLPVNYLIINIQKVLFPTLSKIQNNTEKLKKIYFLAIKLIGFLLIPTGLGISIAAEEIVLTLLGERFLGSVPVVQFFGIIIPIKLLTSFSGVICDATSHLKEKIILQLCFTVVLFGLLYFLGNQFQLEGIIIAVMLGEILRNITYIFIVKNILDFQLKELFKSYYPALLTSLVTCGLIFSAHHLGNHFSLSIYITLAMEIFAGALSLFIMLFAKPNKVILELFYHKAPFAKKSRPFNFLVKKFTNL